MQTAITLPFAVATTKFLTLFTGTAPTANIADESVQVCFKFEHTICDHTYGKHETYNCGKRSELYRVQLQAHQVIVTPWDPRTVYGRPTNLFINDKVSPIYLYVIRW
jgi:hypothetical protein